MKAEIAKLWAERLRNMPEGTQGAGQLGKEDGSRCCLGVLCDLAVEANIIPAPVKSSDPGATDLIYGSDPRRGVGSNKIGEVCYLPDKVKEWAGMSTVNGSIQGEVDGGPAMLEIPQTLEYNIRALHWNSLADANDCSVPFDLIAGGIEKHAEQL